jgi:hypothetical protein
VRPAPEEEVKRMLESLPDEASFEDIQYHIYVQQKIDRGIEASERGDFISDEEIEQRMIASDGAIGRSGRRVLRAAGARLRTASRPALRR